MDIVLANPRGFCAGVDRAIDIVNRALEVFGGPVYVRHEVVHNRHVVDDLRTRGAVFVDELTEVPDDAIVIFSAHGVSRAVQEEAEGRGLQVFDATCPLVTKVHVEVAAFSAAGRECVLIGHAGHPEVEGTMGRYDTSQGGAIYLVEDEEQAAALDVRDPASLAFVTQTTLSVDDTAKVIDALRAKFPEIQGPRKDDICYATQNRQEAVRVLSDEADIVLVLGSQNSSNSQRLAELGREHDVPAHLIDGADEITPEWFTGDETVLITAGASAPERVVQDCIAWLKNRYDATVEERTLREEEVYFPLPKEIRQAAGPA